MARRTVIVADDRTGALETAGRIAQRRGAPVPVRVMDDGARHGGAPDAWSDDVTVVDLATRHLGVDEVVARTEAIARGVGPADRVLHKIDSLLRGRWASELSTLCTTLDRAALVVPALPEADRTCVGGVVRARGVEVDRLADPRGRASVARPAACLPGAVELDLDGLRAWARRPTGVAVCDAISEDDVAAALAAVTDRRAIVSGSAHVVAVAAADGHATSAGVIPAPLLRAPFVFVVGSVHPMARAQADALEGLEGVTVVRTRFDLDDLGGPDVLGGLDGFDARTGATGRVLSDEVIEHVLADLVARATPHLADAATIVIVGGDTVAALLGAAGARVGGMLGPGMPWMALEGRRGVTVVTKPGSHGTPSTLAELCASGAR